jgi:CRISPR/Cas system-associated exonuclease Cas4 (RecB family)
MKPFLENICEEILNKHKAAVSDICVVFPSRRAGIYFKNYLSKKLEKPIWSPAVFSIQDFIEELTDCNFADNLKLLFELFSVYTEVINDEKIQLKQETGYINPDEEESFGAFYPWGEMLLKDFDVIDMHLVDTGLLFKRIKDLKEIDEIFPIELQDIFKKFWGTLFETKQTNAKQNFVKIWQVLGRVYDKFRERLNSENICYPGMAYRKLHETIDIISDNLKWKKIVFAGFNSLNPAERKMMKLLADKGIAEIFWDADDYYISDKNQEAGDFIRKNLKYFSGNKISFNSELLTDSKNIKIIGTSSTTGMAKVLGSELKECIVKGDFNVDKSAIVLPDENLLLPVLYSIPDEIKSINVTMGYPFRDTPLYSLIKLIIELQNNIIYEKGEVKFHNTALIKILLHPYIKFQNTAVLYEIVNLIKKNNIIYFTWRDYKKETPKILEIIFKKIERKEDAVIYISKIMDIISDRIDRDESKESDYKKFQLEYIYNFYTNFNLLNEIIMQPGIEMNLGTYWKLLKDVLGRISIPFTGEPLKGLQVMGLLETRALDFENLFVLCVNEGVLPEGQVQNSFIPYSLRKAFKMPTYEDEDSNTAYYFYRLLQKAKNIYLIYDTDLGNDVKEKSRYLLQIENELLQVNKNLYCTNKIVVPEVYNIEKKNIEIAKDEKVMEKILELKHYSPSVLNKYINCTLQFYFSKIAGMEEEKVIEESFSSLIIGSVLHKILENLYKPLEGKLIDEKIIDDINSETDKNFEKILEESVRDCNSDYVLREYSGKNYLFKNIIYKLLKRVLENEKKEIPFRISKIEEVIEDELLINVKGKEIKVNIFGRMDRIDEKNGITRIIDYKTGGFEFKNYNPNNQNDYFEKLITNPDYKENFQAFFYGYFYSRQNLDKKINVGIYPIKKIQEGIKEIKEDFINQVEYDIFKEKLKKLISEIHDSKIPFTKTEDGKRCVHCPYSEICYRDLKNTI